MSMKPGARTRPLASMTWSPGWGLRLAAMATMRSPEMRTLRLRSGAPVPSAIWAWRMRMAFVGGGVCELDCVVKIRKAKSARNGIANLGECVERTERWTRMAGLLEDANT